jgi:endoglycosylceramidase
MLALPQLNDRYNMKKICFLLIASVFIACGSSNHNSDITCKTVKTSGDRFVDDNGRTLILNGINYVNKNQSEGYLSDKDELSFKKFREYGFNIIRFGIIWDRLEHEPGVINEDYLKEIDKRVEWARDNGIYLMLDFHQDLYSVKWSDGAPKWATIDDGLPHVVGDIWSDSYILSPAINKAFDNFWQNRSASDGIGVQDHYLNMLKVVAKRYANSLSVIGIDVFNEPYGGSLSKDIPNLMVKSFFDILPDSLKKNANVTLNSIRDGNFMMKALKILEQGDNYKTIINKCNDAANIFETRELSKFYQKARDAIRGAGNNKIIFLEHNYFGNTGIRSDFIMPKDERGMVDSQCVYAPHGYDIITDTSISSDDYNGRVDIILDRIEQNGINKKTPVILGEWGAYYNSPSSYNSANHIARIIEAKKFSQTYWSYDENLPKVAYFNTAISRAYPREVNGNIVSYSNNPETKIFEMKWKEQNNGITIIYHPFASKVSVSVMPKSKYKINRILNSEAGYIIINACKDKGERTVRLSY